MTTTSKVVNYKTPLSVFLLMIWVFAICSIELIRPETLGGNRYKTLKRYLMNHSHIEMIPTIVLLFKWYTEISINSSAQFILNYPLISLLPNDPGQRSVKTLVTREPSQYLYTVIL